MPSKASAADVPSDVCCDTWWLIGERIRTIAFAGVCQCIDPSCVDREFSSYSTEGEIHSILGESLVISFLGAGISSGSSARSGAPRPTPITQARYRLELRENGWPLPVRVDGSTETIVQADWQMLHVLSKHARAHGEKMWRSLVQSVTTSDLTTMMFRPSLHPHILQRGVILGDITPLPNTGPQCGYRMNVTVNTQLL